MWFGKDKMKKLFLALAMAVPAFAAPMAPLYFDNISGDQDEYWNYLMMFKLWGTNGIESKTINLPDTIGWVGTAKNGFLAKNANIKLGGPLIFGGDVDFRSNAMDASFVSGPVRVSGDVHMNVRDTIHGTVCVQGTYNKSDDANFDGIAGALYTGSSATTGACADTNVAFVRTDLAAPLLNPAKEYSGVVDISISGQGSIVVPEKTSEKDSVYDLYLERISIGNDGKLYIDMPKGGRLTRIFLKQLSFGTHPSIQVREEGAIIENKKYRGNLLFYVPHGLEFSRTDNYPIQGTFISTDTISILCNMKYAGQMIANKLVLGDQIDGKEFIYKPFDPPEIDPTTLAKGTFKEDNEINWEIPITLDEKAKNDVTFKYCFLVKDSSQTEKGVASIQDFNTKADASKYPDFPICKADSSVYGVVKISSGNKTPDVPVYLNAKFDKEDEPTETLKFMVFELGAAVFPEGMSDGVFDLHIQNTPVFNFKDVQDEYTVVENSEEAVTVAKIEISGATLTTLVAEMVDDDADTNPVKLDDLFAISVDQTNKYVVITVKDHQGELNFESNRIKKKYNITMTLRDDCNTDNCQERTAKTSIKILDKNEVPEIRNIYDPQLSVLATPFDTLRPKENISGGSEVGIVQVEDPDIYSPIAYGHMHFRIEDQTVPFRMDSLRIIVKQGAKLNHESADSVYTFTVYVDNCEIAPDGKWNKNCLTAEHEVTVKIANVPEEPEIQCVAGDTKCNGPFAVAENSKTGTKIHDFVVIDPDINQVKTLVPTLTDDDSTNASELFEAVILPPTTTGGDYILRIQVKDSTKLDYETVKPSYKVTVMVTDDDGLTDSIKRVINVLDVNEAPTIENKDDIVIPENLANGEEAGRVFATDPDIRHVEAFGHLSYRIIEDMPFKMDSNKIIVTNADTLNYEALKPDTTFTFNVEVANCLLNTTTNMYTEACLYDTAEVMVSVKDEPEKTIIIPDCTGDECTECSGPDCHDIMDSLCEGPNCTGVHTHDSVLTLAVKENVRTGYTVIDYVVSDEDVGTGHTDALDATFKNTNSSGAENLFVAEMKKVSGVWHLIVSVIDSVKFDFEKIEELHKLTIYVNDPEDPAGMGDSIRRIIRVVDVNETPTIENNKDIVISENLENGKEAGSVFATDPDIKHVEAFGHLSYRIIEDMPFKMDSNKIIVTNADTLNYEALKPDTTFTFNVEVANCLLNTTTNMYTEACLYDTAEVMVSVKDEPEKTIIIPDCTGDECTECSGPDCHDIMDSLCEGPNCTGVHTHDSVLTLAVKENVRTGYTVIDYVVSDEDVGTGHTDALDATFKNTNSSGAENLFVAEMKKVSGVWHLIVSVLDSSKLDFEAVKDIHELTIYVNDPEDPAGMGDSIRRIIRVVDVNETPVITDVSDFNKDIEESKKAKFTFYPKENMKNDEAIGIVVASDPDTIHKAEFARLEYSIVDTTGIPFKMKDSLVVVKDSSRINYESNKTKYEFVVQVVNCEWEKSGSDYVKTDRCLDPVKQTIKVEIQNVNEEPIIIVDNGPDGGDDSDSLCVAHCDTTGRGVWKDSTKIDSILTVGVRENTEDGRIYSETGKILFQYHYADEDTGHVAGADVDWFVVDSLSTISSESLENLFKLEFSNGTFTVRVKDETLLDYEKLRNAQKRDDPEPEYTVGIVVTDPDGLADTLYRTIRIIDENEKPLFTAEPCVIVEGNQPGDSIGHVEHPSDIDSLSSNPKLYDNYFKMTDVSDDGLFELRKDSTDLMRVVLAALQSIDCEDTAKYHCGDNTRYWVELTYGDTSLQTVYSNLKIPVTILDLNEKPVINTDTIGVDENSPKGTVVDTIKWEDVDFFDSVMHFEITKDPSGCFVIDEKTGVVTVKSDGCSALDYEKNETLKIEVSVTDLVNVPDSLYDDECACQKIFTKDGRPNTVTKTITVNVHDVNEPPHLDDKVISVSEDTKVLTVIDTVKGTDPDKNTTLVYKTVGGDSDVFDVNHRGEVYVKDSLDYETKKEYKILVEVTDGEYRDTATITINVTNVIEQSKVVITQYDNVDSTWEYPEVVYTNKKEGTITWKQDGVEVSMDTIFTKKGENVIVITYQDPHKDLPGRDTLIVYYNDELPTVEVKGFADVVKAENIYTVVENTGDKDTNLYVNKLNNYILVSVKDPDPLNKRDTVFKVNINLEPVNVSQKTLNKVYEISQSKFILNENPSSEVSKTVMNGSEVEVTYNEVVGKDTVTISYRTDSKGDVVKVPVINSKGEVDSIEVITVSYTAVVEGKNVVISYQADAMTGEILVKDATGALMVSGASKNSTMSATKDSVSTKSDTKKSGVSEGMFTITFSASDPLGNSTVVSYSVDEKNNMVKNAEGDVGYAVTYTYKNRYGNAASQSLFIVLDQVGPKVEILSPAAGEVVRSNFVAVKWTVNGVEQDTLTLEGLRKGANPIVRIYRDKAGNEASDTVLVIMKDSKDVEIAIVDPVTEISKDKVDEYYAENPPEEGETFAVSIRNPSTGEEVETLIGGSFKNKEGSGKAPYPNAKDSKKSVHLGPTLAMDVKLPITNSVGGLATMDDLLSSDGMVPLQGLDAENSVKLTVEEYIREHCDDDVKADDDLSRINLYKSKLHIQIWVYTTIGGFVDYFNFTQDMNDPSFTNEAGMLELYFEMKPDKDGFVRTDEGKGRRLATGAYLYKVEANLTSVLRCTLPSVDYDPKTNTFGSKAKKRGEKVKSSEELLKPFGYKRPKE